MSPSYRIDSFCCATLAETGEGPAQSPPRSKWLCQLSWSNNGSTRISPTKATWRCLLPLQCKHYSPYVQAMLLRPSVIPKTFRCLHEVAFLPLEATPRRAAVPPANSEEESSRGSFEQLLEAPKQYIPEPIRPQDFCYYCSVRRASS